MLQPHPSRAAETRHPAFPATRSSRSGGLNHYVCPKRKMLAKSWHKTDSDDTGILHKARNRGREAASGALGAVTVLDPSARIACAEHADCLCEACRLLVRSMQIACAEHADCLCGAPRNLVTASRKGSRLCKNGFRKPQSGYFSSSGVVFPAISDVKISLSNVSSI